MGRKSPTSNRNDVDLDRRFRRSDIEKVVTVCLRVSLGNESQIAAGNDEERDGYDGENELCVGINHEVGLVRCWNCDLTRTR